MLSRILKERIQKKYGNKKIKFPKDCYGLAEQMQLSPSTIKRLFGFVDGTEALRPATKDAIATYLGFDTWDELQNNILGRKIKREPVVEYLDSSNLPVGQIIKIMFGKVSYLKLLCLGDKKFMVLEQLKLKVDVKDELQFDEIKLDYPLLVLTVKKKDKKLRDVLLGELTGATEIQLLQKVKHDERFKSNSLALK